MAKKKEKSKAMAKKKETQFVPHVGTKESKLTKKQRKENRKNGYNLDGSIRSKNTDGTRRKDRTYRSLEQRRLDALAQAAELGERIQMAEFAEDDTIRVLSNALSSLRALDRQELRDDTILACQERLQEFRDTRLSELRTAE